MLQSIAGRCVVVTGASKGIGRGIALRFARAGCAVLVVSRTFAEADAVAAEIARAGGIAIAFAADISKQVEAEAMEAEERTLLASLGVADPYRPHDPAHGNA